MMQRILLFVLLNLLPLQGLADGKVFRLQAIAAEATIPDQRALICWSNGQERLVIETRFSGVGTNFGWVVPLPSLPNIEPASPGVFATLAFQLRPVVEHDPDEWGAAFGLCLAFLWLAFALANPGLSGGHLVGAAVLGGASLFWFSPVLAIFITAIFLFGANRIRSGHWGIGDLLALVLLLLIITAMLLPALGKAGVREGATGGVTELASDRVGAFETKTLAAENSTALLEWLRENKFAVSPQVEPVIAEYIKAGWVFVASKIARDQAAPATNSIHPLSFTFPAEQPVYPLRLTGVDGGPLAVELYVFGPGRAEANHFMVATCATVRFPKEAMWRSRLTDEVPIMHPVLRGWIAEGAIVTRLVGKLLPAQMHEDVRLNWVGFSPHREVRYSSQAALIIAANWAAGICLGAFGLFWVAAKFWSVRWAGRTFLPGGVVIAAIVAIGIYAALPKVPVRAGRFHPIQVRQSIQMISAAAQSEWQTSVPTNLSAARRMVNYGANNFFLGGNIREEDSPGNYTIRETTNGFEFFWYDGNGAEHSLY